MVNYRRDYTPGGVYFFTVTLRDRRSSLLTTYIEILGNAFRKAQQKANFKMPAFVILPEHLHVIWKLPTDDFDYSRRWIMVKASFTKELIKSGLPLILDNRGEYNLWQKRFWEHRIRDETDYQRHIDYIHYNPVKHGLVTLPVEWPYSSIHRFISRGILDNSWGGVRDEGLYGE